MADQRQGGIAWTEETWNPLRGCSKVSAGCANCYAETMAARFCGEGQPYAGLVEDGRWNGKVRLVAGHLDDPIRWRRPRRVFVNSMSDLFHEGVPFETLDRIFGVMAAAYDHTFQVLTKRPARMLEYLSQDRRRWWAYAGAQGDDQVFDRIDLGPQALPNVWLGVTVEDQRAADERIPPLLQTPAALRFLSCEPLLGPVELSNVTHRSDCTARLGKPALEGLHWVICGGESGPKARPMHPDWARSLRSQCSAVGVPFLFKQWGEWAPIHQPWKQEDVVGLAPNERWLNSAGGHGFHGHEVYRMRHVGKKIAGRLLDGHLHDEYPEVPRG